MDKYDIIFDLIEHPEKYSSDEVSDFLSNPEMNELYKILCNTSTVLNSEDYISEEYIDNEWTRLNVETAMKLETNNGLKGRIRSLSRVASVALVIFTSLVAIAVGISVSVSKSDKKANSSATEFSSANVSQMVVNDDTVGLKAINQTEISCPLVFEDTPLEDILKIISEHYEVSVKFRNPETAGIHLFYKFDSSKELEDVVEQLNTFARISISIDGDTIIVE